MITGSSSTSIVRLVSLICLALSATIVSGMNPAMINGYKFFDSVTGKELVIRGIDYYPRPNHGDLNQNSLDLYTEEHRHIWERDISYFQDLGVNAIRLYAVDANEDHDAFMCALEAVGIYVVVALAHDCPKCAVTRDQAPDCYPVQLKKQGQAVINEFAKYSNVLAFSAGNEVNHFAPIGKPEWNGPCQKKFIRDMREYIASCSKTMRKIPVGLVSADSDRDVNTLYYNCQDDPDDEFGFAEWYGLNSYLYCSGESTTYETALGFSRLQKSFEEYQYSIPVLLTEFGCLSESFPDIDGYEGQRTFLQAKWILEEPVLQDLFSGGFAFEYSIEKENAGGESPYPFYKFGKQNYGIGYFEPENCDDIEVPCEYNPFPSFDNLKNVYNNSSMANNVTIDSFVVPPQRQGRSICPDSFPSLQSFAWEADNERFGSCPSRSEARFQCRANHSGRGTSSEWQRSIFTLATVSLGGAAFLYVLYCLGRQEKSVRNPKSCIRKPSDASTGSRESWGLLSMQQMTESKTPYDAIESSDSSSDEMMPISPRISKLDQSARFTELM